MNITSLKGVFPEPKPQPKRNFIKENVKHIKYLQGIIQPSEDYKSSKEYKSSNEHKFSNEHKLPNEYKPPKDLKNPQQKLPTNKLTLKTSKNRLKDSKSQDNQSHKLSKSNQSKPMKKNTGIEVKPRLEIHQLRNFGEITKKEDVANCLFNEKDKITHRGIQTERNEDLNKIYDSGVIKYPSAGIVQEIITARRKGKRNDHGDNNLGALDDKSGSFSDKPDYIKHNINSIKSKGNKSESTTSTYLPSNYQKGVIPKYLKERKEEQLKEVPIDSECPPGHVLLPEEERKETLRVLRQSYADRIQELNSMPVRNDTLKMRKRKMELEEELKKIDEGIKVFQRPKVYVKVNA